ncbi:GGDEF domain-containing protein [Vibrio taketomensis]|uniref:GGDEF domain-containing protein n=1 Tax=Vibrio taketomensis TaxID=2572923 RepID=UPI002F9614DA
MIGFDIDEFKQVNDSFGHLGGDQMLCHVANTVKNCLIGDDIVARLGGDEFCIITAITDRGQLEEYLEVIRLAMMQNTICLNGEAATCSISIGAAIRDQEDAEQIMQLADAQLYMSKNAGRNRVSIA